MSANTLNFVNCPFQPNEFGVISPRGFQEYDLDLMENGASYFSSSIINSFPDVGDRARFLNKFYQCFLCQQLPHKVRKLVVVGASDSGKTSWANVFFGIIPRERIAVLTKEQTFGASMIEDDTELLYLDEWNKEMMTEDLLKTVLQGGYFPQAIKHSTPKMQDMNAGVYMTCNKLPNYGEEQQNIERRLYICETTQLRDRAPEAPRWIRENAMRCIVWMVNVINSNLNEIEMEERFYELDRNVEGRALVRRSVTQKEMLAMKNSTLLATVITPSPPSNSEIHPCFAGENPDNPEHPEQGIYLYYFLLEFYLD